MNAGSEYIIIYLLLWGLTLYLIYIKHNRKFDAAIFLILLNVIYATCSLFSYNDEILNYLFGARPLTLFPFIYLFFSEMLVMSPVLRFNASRYDSISKPNNQILKIFSVVFIFSIFIRLFYVLPNLKDGFFLLLTAEEGGAELYTQAHELEYESHGIIDNLSSVIVNICGDFGIFVFLYFLSSGTKNKYLLYGYIFSIVFLLLYPLTKGLRTGFVMNLLTFSVGFVAMRQFMSKKILKRFKVIGLSFLALLLFLFAILTFSRFNDNSNTQFGGAYKAGFYYVGSANINFNMYCLDANGIRNGDRTVTIFKKLLGFNTPKDLIDIRYKYSNMLIDDSAFSTYVGDFVLDFGPIIAFFIFLCFSLFINNVVSFKGHKIAFHDLLMLYFVMCICAQGGFHLFGYAGKMNYTIIFFLLMYCIFKWDYEKKKKYERNSIGGISYL